MRKTCRSAYTLLEVVIVIVVIGMLAAGMMMSMGQASNSADAARIVSMLRNAKAAANLWFTVNPSRPFSEIVTAWGSGAVQTKAEILSFMDPELRGPNIVLGVSASNSKLFVGYNGLVDKPELVSKLQKSNSGSLLFNGFDVNGSDFDTPGAPWEDLENVKGVWTRVN